MEIVALMSNSDKHQLMISKRQYKMETNIRGLLGKLAEVCAIP